MYFTVNMKEFKEAQRRAVREARKQFLFDIMIALFTFSSIVAIVYAVRIIFLFL